MEQPHTPPRRHNAKPASTVTKTRFFDAFDARSPTETLLDVIKQLNFPFSQRTTERWLKKRREAPRNLVHETYHRSGKHHNRLSKVTDVQLDTLLDPKNPVRTQDLQTQIDYYHIPVAKRTIQTNLIRRRRKARRYKMAVVTSISKKNKRERVKYGKEHQDKTVPNFWRYIFFSDEAHIDPAQTSQIWILREQGTRFEPENLQHKPFKVKQKFHIAAMVSWDYKSPLQFYNDERDHLSVEKKPRKPRKLKYETEKEYQKQVMEWEASLPHDVEAESKGNKMTQKYYTERLLPVYIQKIREDSRNILQEDNDSSHGTRSKNNVAQLYKEVNSIKTLRHPAQSPDLNPIEGIWNILKMRVRKRYSDWRTMEELKQVILEEWDKITMDEIRARIAEMPARCRKLVSNGGERIKSKLW
jgi:hypothetical protein